MLNICDVVLAIVGMGDGEDDATYRATLDDVFEVLLDSGATEEDIHTVIERAMEANVVELEGDSHLVYYHVAALTPKLVRLDGDCDELVAERVYHISERAD